MVMDETKVLPTAPTKRSGRFRTLLRATLVVVGLLIAAVGGGVFYALAFPPRYPVRDVELRVESSPERVARGKALASTLECVICHSNPATGRLTGRRLAEIPSALSPAAYTANITRDVKTGIGAWSDGELVAFLRTGVNRQGRLAPPWMPRLPRLADEDLFDLLAYLRSDDPAVEATTASPQTGSLSILGKILMRYAWRPMAYPAAPIVAPALSDRVAYGRYVVQAKGSCFGCHSANFMKLDEQQPERSDGYLGGGNEVYDAAGSIVISANLTPDRETGIGRWSEAEFVRAVREGLRPDGTPVRGPMQLYKELSEAEVGAVYAYLQTVPPLHRPRPTTDAPKAITASAEASSDRAATLKGRALYERYGCRSCHGDTGVDIGDLRQADNKYATDAEIEAWIRHPEAFKPGTKMPAFGNVIASDDFPPLIAYVRQLGRRSKP
ncbi:Cytochrome c2 [Singulisphaera sp. GP187]|uniref:cytochrome c n=1 Tax=Singulisphaera sp. GP187 TaxID=1882752 RepID=UPI00092AD012|nr:c-type cytochrome [Singulisphaera sp. GP187]SIO12040.1 Cytochrome c2 [Singulisphaera sp. GP187]